jgi:hypothetical protein
MRLFSGFATRENGKFQPQLLRHPRLPESGKTIFDRLRRWGPAFQPYVPSLLD